MIGLGYGYMTFTSKLSEDKKNNHPQEMNNSQNIIPQQQIPFQPQMMQMQMVPMQMFQQQIFPQQPQINPQFQMVQNTQMYPQFQMIQNPQTNLIQQSFDSNTNGQVFRVSNQQANQNQQFYFQPPNLNFPQQQMQFSIQNSEKPQNESFVVQQNFEKESNIQIDQDENFARMVDLELNGNIQNRNRRVQVVEKEDNSVDNLIFVGINAYVVAVNKYSANTVWSNYYGGLNGGIVSLHFSKGKILIGNSGKLHCVNPLDGKEIWSNELKGLRYSNVSISN